MKKIALVAARDFVATISNKGFIVGLLIMPALGFAFAAIGPRVMNARSPQVRGDVAVIDPTGRVGVELREALDPAALAARREEAARRTLTEAARGVGVPVAVPEQAVRTAVGNVPALRVVERQADADVQRDKDWLIATSQDAPHLALIVVRADAVERAAAQPEFGSYDLYISPALDEATESVVAEAVRLAIVSARLKASSLDRAAVEATMRVARPRSVIVAAGGEQQAQRGFTRALPFILGVLLFLGVMLGGQTLMTSMIEEKSDRVVEVLLAAVSPFQLMAGKLLGQLAISFLVMAIYVAIGLFTLFSFAMMGLVDPILIVYLLIFFVITYLVFGALMLSIGAAVSQIGEAQSLMGPVMILLITPYLLTPVIGRAPNSTFSVAVSFIPPVNTFAMMARLASSAPPPAWQVGLTMVVGLLTAIAAIWFAGKVFRIGLLTHGKPPSFATLLRWARAA